MKKQHPISLGADELQLTLGALSTQVRLYRAAALRAKDDDGRNERVANRCCDLINKIRRQANGEEK